MKRTYTFVQRVGTVKPTLPDGSTVEIPIFPGIFKHLQTDQLPELLKNPDILRKYTLEALRKASWPILRQFPPSWLKIHLEEAYIRPGRLNALKFLLSKR